MGIASISMEGHYICFQQVLANVGTFIFSTRKAWHTFRESISIFECFQYNDSYPMKNLLLVCALLLGAMALRAQSALQPVKIADGIQMGMPAEFYLMTEDEMAAVVLTYRKPFAMYKSTQTSDAVLSVNESVSNWPVEDLSIMRSFCRATVRSLHTEIEFIRDEIVEVNGRQLIVFEFKSVIEEAVDNDLPSPGIKAPAPPEHKYNYIQYAVVNGKVWVFNFYCPLGRMENWAETAKNMMQSIQID